MNLSVRMKMVASKEMVIVPQVNGALGLTMNMMPPNLLTDYAQKVT